MKIVRENLNEISQYDNPLDVMGVGQLAIIKREMKEDGQFSFNKHDIIAWLLDNQKENFVLIRLLKTITLKEAIAILNILNYSYQNFDNRIHQWELLNEYNPEAFQLLYALVLKNIENMDKKEIMIVYDIAFVLKDNTILNKIKKLILPYLRNVPSKDVDKYSTRTVKYSKGYKLYRLLEYIKNNGTV